MTIEEWLSVRMLLDQSDEIEFLTRRLDEKEKELEAAESAWRNRGNEIERVKEILSDCVTRMKRTRTILQGKYIDKGWSQERINLHANWGILDTTKEEAVLTEREKKSFRGFDDVELLKTALHHISLASQSSMSNKEECGRIAREALAATMEKKQ